MKQNLSLDKQACSGDKSSEENTQEDQKAEESQFETTSDNTNNSDSHSVQYKIKLLEDAGYNAGENLKYLDEQKNIDAYVSMNRRDEDELSL